MPRVGPGPATDGYDFDTVTSHQICRLSRQGCDGGDPVPTLVRADGFAIMDSGASADGGVYVFDGATGAMLRQLTPPASESDPAFGQAVAVSGTQAAVGSQGDASAPGAVYLFDALTGGVLARFTAPDGAAGDRFGYSVALSGTRLLAGATGGGSGAVYLFDTETGEVLRRFTAPAGLGLSDFGGEVAFLDDRILIGAQSRDGTGGTSPTALLFDGRTGEYLTRTTPVSGGPAIFSGGATARTQTDSAEPAPAPAIPLPAAFWLLAAALGGTVLIRKGTA
ncbi:WD40 repeat domain-containing protein [Pseudooceanicola batsensis]|nr:FG-GAP repeat protein [Pseudooceanicola batsensis]